MNKTLELTTERQRALISDIRALVHECRQAESELKQRHAAEIEALKQSYETEKTQTSTSLEEKIAGLTKQYKELREQAIVEYETQSYELLKTEEDLAAKIKRHYAIELEEIKQRFNMAQEEAKEAFERDRVTPEQNLNKFREWYESSLAELGKLEKQSAKLLRRRGCQIPDGHANQQPLTGRSKKECADRFNQEYQSACARLQDVQDCRAARFVEEGWPVLLGIFAALAAIYPLGASIGWSNWFVWVPAVLVAGVLVLVLLRVIVRPIGRKQTLARWPAFQASFQQAKGALDSTLRAAESEAKQQLKGLTGQRDQRLTAAHQQWSSARSKLEQQHTKQLQDTQTKIQTRRTAMSESHDRDLTDYDREYLPKIDAAERELSEILASLQKNHEEEVAGRQRDFDEHWSDLTARWRNATAEFVAGVAEMSEFCSQRFPAWEQFSLEDAANNREKLVALPFGSYEFDLTAIDGGLPESEDFQTQGTSFVWPALLSFPGRPSLLLEAEAEGREIAVHSLQNVMLRMLSSLPPGKVHFTIIDPVGLGQNFSMFMHLADYDDRLVANRIWTESSHINARLTDLTEHMENVIQKYLRNEFASIQEYNEFAGEVAEPFQVLVVANFPANCSEDAARRLVSIASSGARCGVYTLISTDTRMKLPRNFDLGDLERHAATLIWQDGQFCWQQQELRSLPLTLEQPPDDEQVTELVKEVGRQAKDASRVEVPFEIVVAEDEKWWTGDSGAELEVPLGRVGATKLQYLRLGKGTSQHVLIAGKTGSGKSTLLHALVTNLAIHYSPDQVQFYLIDFKKGVEFKAYATLGLPHARVIAIESEREFGMSVLEGLDDELKRRGDLFRQHGVQDIDRFRHVCPDEKMPRLLLIIDEFQEFFVVDDKIAQDASLLFDRLVRQGRAFGIHVLLGSQTLAGAYSLARSTIGQMAVRIALQCSETDAHLILSEDNTAARLLSRPGEAIFNDANGLMEGNNPFQIVWLSDHQREYYLDRVSKLAAERSTATEPPIVFEGNVAAAPENNPKLNELLKSLPTDHAMIPRAWLGDAVAIKEPTSVTFERHGGSNLLMVGQAEELALGVLANCIISLAAQQGAANAGGETPNHDSTEPSGSANLFILDGTRPESPEFGFWKRFVKRLPIHAKTSSTRETNEAIGQVTSLLDQRKRDENEEAPPIYLVLHNLARFRDLQKSDDFGFSSFSDDEQESAGKQLATILRDGPAYGIHTLVWCDTYNNASRWIDRQTMHDFGMRVLFQMGAGDSSNLMDSPAASKLGQFRAILYVEERGQHEKFRPYGLPSPDWLDTVRNRLQNRIVEAT